MKKLLVVASFLLLGLAGFAQSGAELLIPNVAVCDSPDVVIPVRVKYPVSDVGKFRVGLRYYNGGFYFNGNFMPNPAISGLNIQYWPGGATDWIVVERNDSTPVSLNAYDELFSLGCSYFGSPTEIQFDTFDLSPWSCYMRDSQGNVVPLGYDEGSVGNPQIWLSLMNGIAPDLGDTTTVQVYVQGANNIGAIKFSIDFDETRLSYAGLAGFHPALGDGSTIDLSAANGILDFSWYAAGPLASIPSADLLFLKFKVVQWIWGFAPMNFIDHPYNEFTDFVASDDVPTCYADGGIPFVTSVDEPVTTGGFVIAPNPGRDEVEFILFVAAEFKAVLEIRDMSGRMVFLEKDIRLSPGSNTLRPDMGFLARGAYLVKLTVENGDRYSGLLLRQ